MNLETPSGENQEELRIPLTLKTFVINLFLNELPQEERGPFLQKITPKDSVESSSHHFHLKQKSLRKIILATLLFSSPAMAPTPTTHPSSKNSFTDVELGILKNIKQQSAVVRDRIKEVCAENERLFQEEKGRSEKRRHPAPPVR